MGLSCFQQMEVRTELLNLKGLSGVSFLEIKGFCQFIGTYKIQYIGLYFDHKADETKQTIAFNLFYYLLDNLNLPLQENNFFLYRLIDSKKKYDVYSTFFNSNKSSLIYKKEEN